MSRIRNFMVMLRGRLWLIPIGITVSGALLAYAMVTAGSILAFLPSGRLWWLYSGDAETARNLLSTLLSGLMTMTSLVVSVTFVILTLAASQLGPRLIGIFMADRHIQSVLGLFLGTIVYVLVVLRSLGDELGEDGVPHIAITVGSALTLVCLFALLFYVHKIARSVIADTVVDRVAADLCKSVPELTGSPADQQALPEPLITGEPTETISLGRSGYIQTIDYDDLVTLACEHDAIFRLHVRAGHFVLCHGRHLEAFAKSPLDEKALRRARSAFVIGTERSPAQDLEYSVRQLVEIALRALSPGINDTFTAIAVVDRLAAALEQIVLRRLLTIHLGDKQGIVRVIADRSTYDGLFDAAFDSMRQSSAANPAMLIRIADSLGALAPSVSGSSACAAILTHLGKLREAVRSADFTPSDHQDLIARIDNAEQRVGNYSPRVR
jgi:uncharacterized membrane protein